MAADAEGAGGAVEEGAGAVPEESPEWVAEVIPDDVSTLSEGGDADDEDTPYFVEVWNDYDPSMRFVALFPVGEDQGATASSVAYYIIEPGRHSGLHSDNVEEVIFVAEGEGEAFVTGSTRKLRAGQFAVLPAGMEHDIYAQGAGELRLLSFFPTAEIVSTFQQAIYPMAGNVLSSKPPQPVVTELDPENLPEDFPFDLADLGMGDPEPGEPSMTQRLLGLAPDEPPAGEEPGAAEAQAEDDDAEE